MDMNTLLDRTNDAINTIIRLDETTEKGEFLQPCIEGIPYTIWTITLLLILLLSLVLFVSVAALHLGCTPRRASRSQRNINPRCYLSQDSTKLDNILSPQYQAFMKQNNFCPKNLQVMSFHSDVQEKWVERCPVSKYSSYPLCYSFRVPSLPRSNNVTDSYKSNKSSKPVIATDATKGTTTFDGCDLSLRLGPLGDIRSPSQKRSKISSCNNSNKSWKLRVR